MGSSVLIRLLTTSPCLGLRHRGLVHILHRTNERTALLSSNFCSHKSVPKGFACSGVFDTSVVIKVKFHILKMERIFPTLKEAFDLN